MSRRFVILSLLRLLLHKVTDFLFTFSRKPERKDSSGSSEEDSDEEDTTGSKAFEPTSEEIKTLSDQPAVLNQQLQEIEMLRLFGDTKFYCPVTLKERNVLRMGFPQFACKYKDRLYYFADQSTQNKFLKEPEMYLGKGAPLKVPPVRICITGINIINRLVAL